VSVSQRALVAAVQLQFEVTPMLPELPLEGKLALVGESTTSQAAAGCVMVNSWLAMAIVPVRGCPAVLAATVYPTIPFPAPGLPEEIEIQAALLVAVQMHSGPAPTSIDPEPPPTATLALRAPKLTVHGTPDWLRLKVCPAILSEPIRGADEALAATE
jgi:hypothetical protein